MEHQSRPHLSPPAVQQEETLQPMPPATSSTTTEISHDTTSAEPTTKTTHSVTTAAPDEANTRIDDGDDHGERANTPYPPVLRPRFSMEEATETPLDILSQGPFHHSRSKSVSIHLGNSRAASRRRSTSRRRRSSACSAASDRSLIRLIRSALQVRFSGNAPLRSSSRSARIQLPNPRQLPAPIPNHTHHRPFLATLAHEQPEPRRLLERGHLPDPVHIPEPDQVLESAQDPEAKFRDVP